MSCFHAWPSRTSICGVLALALLVAHSRDLAGQSEKEIIVTIKQKKDPATSALKTSHPSVDVAVLLDTSNSMDGLIHQAKNQLWTIVQQFAKAKRDGQTPILRVALFEYGNNGLPASEGYLRQVVPLTDDLDRISEALFSLTTNGGDEYCGQVIDQALVRLDWSKEPNAYKAIFIAGNEPFTQGSVDYRSTCSSAIQRGVIVNTIHCGDLASGIEGKWKDGADLAEGKFFNINQDQELTRIQCPQDEMIIRLNAELNHTYLWIGSREAREGNAARQKAQDAAAGSQSPATASERAIVKASPAYSNRERDLVEIVAASPESISQIREADLPDELQAMTPEEREKAVKDAAAKREQIKQQIAALAKERADYLATAEKEQAGKGKGTTLGEAITLAVREQLTAAGFSIED